MEVEARRLWVAELGKEEEEGLSPMILSLMHSLHNSPRGSLHGSPRGGTPLASPSSRRLRWTGPTPLIEPGRSRAPLSVASLLQEAATRCAEEQTKPRSFSGAVDVTDAIKTVKVVDEVADEVVDEVVAVDDGVALLQQRVQQLQEELKTVQKQLRDNTATAKAPANAPAKAPARALRKAESAIRSAFWPDFAWATDQGTVGLDNSQLEKTFTVIRAEECAKTIPGFPQVFLDVTTTRRQQPGISWKSAIAFVFATVVYADYKRFPTSAEMTECWRMPVTYNLKVSWAMRYMRAKEEKN